LICDWKCQIANQKSKINDSRMIITIDGPAGTGKSTVALLVAEGLGFDFLDTGAMYRSVALDALRRQVNLEEPRELAFVARHAHITFDWSAHPPRVLLGGDEVGHLLRSAEVTRAASYVAIVPGIREILVAQQRQIGLERKNLVSEGRDQGSVVFPHAEMKFYLDATPQERARRRVAQHRDRGEMVDFNEILDSIISRDRRDAGRSTGPLVVPEDAVVVDTTHLTQDQVVQQINNQAKAVR